MSPAPSVSTAWTGAAGISPSSSGHGPARSRPRDAARHRPAGSIPNTFGAFRGEGMQVRLRRKLFRNDGNDPASRRYSGDQSFQPPPSRITGPVEGSDFASAWCATKGCSYWSSWIRSYPLVEQAGQRSCSLGHTHSPAALMIIRATADCGSKRRWKCGMRVVRDPSQMSMGVHAMSASQIFGRREGRELIGSLRQPKSPRQDAPRRPDGQKVTAAFSADPPGMISLASALILVSGYRKVFDQCHGTGRSPSAL